MLNRINKLEKKINLVGNRDEDKLRQLQELWKSAVPDYDYFVEMLKSGRAVYPATFWKIDGLKGIPPADNNLISDMRWVLSEWFYAPEDGDKTMRCASGETWPDDVAGLVELLENHAEDLCGWLAILYFRKVLYCPSPIIGNQRRATIFPEAKSYSPVMMEG